MRPRRRLFVLAAAAACATAPGAVIASGAHAGAPAAPASACHVRGLLPDPRCTPGEAFPGAGVAQICRPGYAESVRNVPASLKRSVYARYGIYHHVEGTYEVDHLIPLELGGDNAVANLWPEASPGYRAKDRVENALHDAVCTGRVGLRRAQQQIARDWRHTAVGTAAG